MGFKFGGILSRLLGSGAAAASGVADAEAVEYKGYKIRPACRRDGGQWLTVGVIAKQVGDELKQEQFIRADKYATKEDAEACAITKGRQIIDEQGDRLFRDG
jgi:hypothetical protein